MALKRLYPYSTCKTKNTVGTCTWIYTITGRFPHYKSNRNTAPCDYKIYTIHSYLQDSLLNRKEG